MNLDDTTFELFLASRMKEKGVSLKKLTELTGIAPSHIENMLRGDFEGLPSAPYFRGYLIRIGNVLDFSGEEWWKKIKEENNVRNSGPADSLPENRFMKRSAPKWLWLVVPAAIVVVAYLALELPRVLGKPALTIAYPTENPFTTTSSTVTFHGTVANADSLDLNGSPVTIAPDGSWQENVLLQDGLNTFQISAKKFLGRETDLLEQVLYQPVLPVEASSTSATSSTTISTGKLSPL